ncbi:MAG: thioredoxin domain-containing protein [Bradymonadaceae bacterium]|nr:thioredoxin domain-containing protein [Lujinxingiaceae bacterium]
MAIEQKSSGGTAMAFIATALIAFVLGWVVGSKNIDPSGDSRSAAVGAASAPTEGGAAASGVDSTKLPIADSPIRGNANAPITVVDFSSLQCPFCSRGNDTLKQLLEKYPNDVRIVSKNFPLGFQEQSPAAAKAAMAAGEQGKYWEMKDHLFKNMQAFRGADMNTLTAGYAGELGLNVEKFKADMAKPDYDAKIKRDMDLGASLGVQGTPHYFVNGERVSGAQPLEAFEAIVKRQLGEAKSMLAAGVSRDALYKEMVDKNYKDEAKAPAQAPAAAAAVEVHMIPVRPTDAVKGSTDDYLVTVMEFSSFQCPFCTRGADTIRELVKKYPKNVRFVYKHFPLAFQAQSEPAARAAVAAGEQGKFWEMYDLIYENQRSLAQEGIFDDLAKRVGLNLDKFKKDMEAPATAERVKQNQADGSAAGVRGTPAFTINGIKLVGAKPAAEFIVEIDKQLEIAAKIKKDKNLKGDALYAAVVEHNKANAPAAPAAAAAAAPAPEPKVGPDDLKVGSSYSKGPANAPITIYEFSSFQCPFCARGAETLREVQKAYPGKIRIVYKNFPLAFQAQAEPAARASLAAGRQNKFWEMYDAIYEGQRSLTQEGIFEEWATKIGLNVAQFTKDMADPAIAEQVKAEQAEGSKIGVRGTPAFFINGERLVGAQPIDKFKEVIDAELAKK